MALAKSRFLVAAPVNYRAARAAGTESSQIIQQMALAKSRLLVAAPVNYRAAPAARYRRFAIHPMALVKNAARFRRFAIHPQEAGVSNNYCPTN
jgi:hypothetical protein